MLDGHTLGAVQVVITDEAWNGLTEDQQAILMEAGEDASANNRANSENKENEVLEQLKADGVTVVEVEDKAPWKEACKDVIESNTSDQAELYQQLLDME